MAIFTPGALVGAISGKVGGVVFVQAKKQAVVRYRPAPRRTPSTRQHAQLARFVNYQHAWADLTDAQRLMWRNEALNQSISNRLGNSSPPGAFQFFCKVNSELRRPSDNLLDEPTVRPESSPPLTVTANFTEGGPYTVDAGPPEGFLSAVFFVYGFTTCKDYVTRASRQWRVLFASGRPTLSVDVQPEWDLIFGPLVATQVFSIAVADSVGDNYISTKVIVDGVTAP